MKRNGVFQDPLALKLDGERVLPKGDRAAFEEGAPDSGAAADGAASAE